MDELEKIITELTDSVKAIGLDYQEFLSFLIVAKFETDLANNTLISALKTLFARFSMDETLDGLDALGFTVDGKSFTEICDQISDKYPTMNPQDQAKLTELVGGGLQISILIKCFRKL